MALQDTQPDNKNFLSPIGFQFSIQKLPHVNYFVQSANIPEITLSEVERMSPFVRLPTPGTQLTFGSLELRFRVDEDLKNYKEIYNWMMGLGFPDHFEQRANIGRSENTGTVSVGEVLSDATLLITTASYQTNISINFIDAYPTSLSTLEFNINATDVEYLEATSSFTYRKYDIVDLV
tara:strand:+ start:366 stop:899 length:534 start_codon:yes stop_codon:yes gene_type:complete